VRSEGRVFTYSAGLCQVALDRAARLAEQLNLPGPGLEMLELRRHHSAGGA
jgi:hypothetical protein